VVFLFDFLTQSREGAKSSLVLRSRFSN